MAVGAAAGGATEAASQFGANQMGAEGYNLPAIAGAGLGGMAGEAIGAGIGRIAGRHPPNVQQALELEARLGVPLTRGQRALDPRSADGASSRRRRASPGAK